MFNIIVNGEVVGQGNNLSSISNLYSEQAKDILKSLAIVKTRFLSQYTLYIWTFARSSTFTSFLNLNLAEPSSQTSNSTLLIT